MEKKSTKIAYFVALGVFIVLLVILGVMFKDAPLPTLEVDGEMIEATTPFAGTFWSLLPPIVAIVLALISKEVYSSLFLGCLVGALLVSNFHPWETVVQLVEGDNGIVTTVSDAGNISIMEYLMQNNIAKEQGGSITIEPCRWCIKAGTGQKDLMMVYVNDEDMVNFDLTVPITRAYTQPSVERAAILTLFAAQIGQVKFMYYQPVAYHIGI